MNTEIASSNADSEAPQMLCLPKNQPKYGISNWPKIWASADMIGSVRFRWNIYLTIQAGTLAAIEFERYEFVLRLLVPSLFLHYFFSTSPSLVVPTLSFWITHHLKLQYEALFLRPIGRNFTHRSWPPGVQMIMECYHELMNYSKILQSSPLKRWAMGGELRTKNSYTMPPSLQDFLIGKRRTNAYTIQIWYLLLSFIFLLTVLRLANLLYCKCMQSRRSGSTHTEIHSTAPYPTSHLRRFPLAIVNSYRVIVLRCAVRLNVGTSYTLSVAEVCLTLAYIIALFTWTFINSAFSLCFVLSAPADLIFAYRLSDTRDYTQQLALKDRSSTHCIGVIEPQ